MSLEAAIAENTVALKTLIATLETTNAGREAAVAAVVEAGKSGTTRRSAKTTETPAVVTGRPAGSPNKPAETVKPAGLPTVEDLRAAAVIYSTAPADIQAKGKEAIDAWKAPRKDFIKSIVQHLGLESVVGAAEEDRAKVIAWFEASARGEAVVFDEGQDEASVEEEEDDGIG